MDILILHRNRFQPVNGATATKLSGNAWTLKLPIASMKRFIKGTPRAEALDGVVFVVEDLETEPAVGTGEDQTHLYASVYAFPGTR